MIAVQVTYTVNDAYVNTNKEMIEAFLTDFRKSDGSQFLYSVLQTEDRKTFIHISQYKDRSIQDLSLIHI